jgi:hypothetical protein
MGQQPVFQWAKQFGSSVADDTNFDMGKTIAVDAQGNVYSAGIFFNTVDFDPGPGVYNLTGGGIYISKLSGDGDFIFHALVPLSIQTFRLEVYHRDGHLIFQTTDPGKKWNGTYKGVTYPSQTFVWQCFYQLKDKPAAYKNGTVTLVR